MLTILDEFNAMSCMCEGSSDIHSIVNVDIETIMSRTDTLIVGIVFAMK